MNLKRNTLVVFVLICFPVIISSQNSLLIKKDIYQGPYFRNFNSKIVKEINAKTGLGKSYLKFNESNQYLYESEIEDVIIDTKILISYRDNYVFSDKDTIFTYNLNERGALLVMTFNKDKSSRCEVLFSDNRQLYFESRDLEVFVQYFIDSLDIIKKIQ